MMTAKSTRWRSSRRCCDSPRNSRSSLWFQLNFTEILDKIGYQEHLVKMGREKDRLIEEEERGWYSGNRNLVCNSCVQDDDLSEYIEEHGDAVACDYCGLDPEDADVRSVPFDTLMDVIGEGINWAYGSADNEGIPYESAEGGYAFPNSVFDTYDLVTDVLGIDARSDVIRDIVRALPDRMWCKKNFASLSLGEALSSSWGEFTETVKYSTRYLFTLPEPFGEQASTGNETESEDQIPMFPSADPDFEIEFDRQDGILASEMLDAIGKVVRRLELVHSVPIGTRLFRVRVHDKSTILTGPEDFGPPDREAATQPNRMSPAGIVMFYGAMDGAAAILETFQPGREGAQEKNVSVAQFETLRELRVLDLTNLPRIPSIFDSASRDLGDGIGFLHEFVDDLIQPVERDGHEHIEYVPTQIVTEYFRHRFITDDGRLDGIFYRSARRQNGTACVLFIDRHNCGVPTERWVQAEQVLRLDENATLTYDGATSNDWFTRD